LSNKVFDDDKKVQIKSKWVQRRLDNERKEKEEKERALKAA
jgi:hypothetical protein